jgi:hypothetical protein
MNISFSATTEQARQHRKHCTRRVDKSLRLSKLKPGRVLQGIEKGQGIKKGEHVIKLDQIIVLEVNREPLKEICNNPIRGTPENIRQIYEPVCGRRPCEITLEGFPEVSPRSFVDMFCKINPRCTPDTEVTRILFDYVRE